jgi:hypothetical protein
MSFDVSEVHVQQYTDNLAHLFQQGASKLRGTVLERTCVGRSDSWDRIAPTEAIRKTTRHGETPRMRSPYSKRLAELVDWEWADLLDVQDRVRMLMDPRSDLARNGVAAVGRAFDLEIIRSFDAPTPAGGDGATGTVTFSSESRTFDFSIAALHIDNLLTVKQVLDDNDVPAEGRHIVLPPAGFTQLLAASSEPMLGNVMYNEVKALVAGEIDVFIGMTFHKSTLLPRPIVNVRYGYAWHEAAVGLSIGSDLETEIFERADRSYSLQVVVTASIGAVRLQGEGVSRFKINTMK